MYITHHPDALGIYTEFFHILNNFDLDVSIEYKVYDGCREGTILMNFYKNHAFLCIFTGDIKNMQGLQKMV